jgi:hypothetical protein
VRKFLLTAVDRRTLRVAAIALLCIVALAVAAATLDSAQQASDGMGFNSDESGMSEDEGDGMLDAEDEEGELEPPSGDIPSDCSRSSIFRSPRFLYPTALLAVLLFVGIAWRTDKLVAVSVFVTLGIPVGIIYAFLASCPGPDSKARSLGLGENTTFNLSAPKGGGVPGSESGATPVPPSMLVLALLGVVLVFAVVVVFRGTADDDATDVAEESAEEPDDEEAIRAISRVAGETADRIDEAGDLDNEVYRAWREMVDHLQVERPDATTPGEFADAAVEAGMEPADVEELTDLFETVRYGGFDPTEERETQAVEALRRVEGAYGGPEQ